MPFFGRMFGGGNSQMGNQIGNAMGGAMRPQVQQGMAPPQAPTPNGLGEMQQANLAPQEEQQAPNQMQQLNSADRIGGSGIGPSPQMMQGIQAGGMMGRMGQQGGMGGLGNMMQGAAPMAAMMGRMGMAPGSQRPPMFGQGQQIGPMGKFMGPQQPQAPMNQMGRGIGPSQQMMQRRPQQQGNIQQQRQQ